MKILALADRKITQDLVELVQKESIDMVLLLGDLKFNEIQDLSEVTIPVVGVLGNHCSFDYFPNLNGVNCHLKKIDIKDLSFFGYEGCPYYKGGEFESTQDECEDLIEEYGEYADILIAHSPASGINSSDSPHEGFDGLLNYINKYKPRFFFHGHSYPPIEQKISKYGETIVVYVSGLEIIDLNSFNSQEYPISKKY